MPTKNVRLARFRLLAYRSCRDTQFSTDTGVTALIGPNGAGKTNLLHGLLLLRGQSNQLLTAKEVDETYTRECKVEADFVVARKRILFKAAIIYRPTEQNRDQIIAIDERWNFKDITGNSRWLSTEEIVFGSKYFSRNTSVSLKLFLRRDLFRFASTSFFGPDSLRLRPTKANRAFLAIQRFRSGISYYSASQFRCETR